MKPKSILFVALIFACNINAGIIDYDDVLADSFKDTDTGLIWMDFGVNNNQSYNFVASQLGVGSLYEGWRLPTIDEVYAMWFNVANLNQVDADYEDPNFYGPGQLYAYDYNSQGSDDSVWEIIFEAIGHSYTSNVPGRFQYDAGIGWFVGINGLSRLEYYDYSDLIASDTSVHADSFILRDFGNFETQRDIPYSSTSTLLIWSGAEPEVAQVPAPASIVLFALGMLGIGTTRLRLK